MGRYLATFAHGPLPHGDPHLSVDWHGLMLDCRGGGISAGITFGIAGSARQGHLHKCPSGEDIEEESVVVAADLHSMISSRSIRIGSSPAMELSTAALLLRPPFSPPRHFADCAANPGTQISP